MKKIYSTKSQGVTIIEMTIVIALLSIIAVIFFLSYEFFVKKSKVTKIAIDAKEYTRTLESFHLVYGGLPGDLASAKRRISSDLIDGDGDGRIQNETEQFQVWPHLSKSNMLEQNFQTLATNTTPELGVNLPAIRNSDNLAIGVIYNTPSGYRANSFIIGGLNGRDVSRPVLTQGDIRLGDQKYDDNNPTGGSWMCGKNPPSPSDCNYSNTALDGENFMLYLPITRSLASGSSSSSCPAQSLQIGQLVANIPEIQPANTYTGNCRGINANYAGTYQVKCSQQTNGQYSLEILSNSCTLKTCTNTFTTANITDSTSVQTGNVIVGNNLVYSCNSPKVPKQVKCVASLTDDTASFDTTPSCIDSTTIGIPGNIPIYQTDVLFKDSGKKFNDVGSTSNDILTAEKVYQLLGKTTIENNYVTKFDANNNKLLQSILFDNASTVGIRSNESTAWSTTPPSSKALLELRSTVQGFLPPRMTEQQRNNLVSSLTTTEKTALAGLVVFNTDSGQLQVWDGKSWSEERALETVPVGTIVAWSKSDTNSIPAGWLLLNGQSVLVSEYPDLAAAFPNWTSGSNVNLPDFRGYFLRGYGTNTDGTTSGTGAFLTSQGFATALPTNAFSTNTAGLHTHGYITQSGGGQFDVSKGSSRAIGTLQTDAAGNHSHSITSGGDSETRPKNIAVHYIIKAREISMSDDNIQAIVQALMDSANVGNRLVKYNSEGTKLVSSVISEKDNGNSTFSLGVKTDSPNPKALLELQSTSQGFLPPRMTVAQRNAITDTLSNTEKTALAGLVVFNTETSRLQYWDGTTWTEENAAETVPVGTIMAWGINANPPSGWLVLNGQQVSASTYPELAALFPTRVSGSTLTLPDFRGYFLRGYGTNTNDGGVGATSGTGAFLSFQQDDFKSHTHRIAIETSGGWNGWVPQGSDRGVSGWSSQYVESTGGTETRSKNIAVHYIIKAKSVSMSEQSITQIVEGLLGNSAAQIGNRVVKFNSDGTKLVTTVINEKDNGDGTVSLGINTDNPNPKALLELKSSVKGFLPPRMTQTERDTISPAASEIGMTIYNTTSGYLEIWNGSAWNASVWSKTNTTDKTTNPTADIKYDKDIAINSILIGKGNGSGNAGSTALGVAALKNSTTGQWNTAIGNSVLMANTTGEKNTALGNSSLTANTIGNNNTAIGLNSLWANTTGSNNTALGLYSLTYNTIGNNNTANGSSSLYSNTTGSENTALGSSSLMANTTGSNNTAIGLNSLWANTIGSNNTAIGKYSLTYNTTGNQNTAIGRDALYANTTGNSNTAIGYLAGNAITTGSNNIVIGDSINPPSATGNNQIAIGTNGVTRIFVDSDGDTGLGTTSPNAKALLELKSSAKGFLPPRMTQTQRDVIITSLNSEADPVAAKTALAGLIIYNQTTALLETWNGVEWIAGGGGVDTTPVGTVVAWTSNNTPPDGWLLLNGQTFSTSAYPQLASIFPSGQLPDFRGYFLRGYGTNGDGTTSGAFLTNQDYATALPKAGWSFADMYRMNVSNGIGFNQGYGVSGDNAGIGNPKTEAGFNVIGGDTETRPKNIAVNYIIKAKAVTLSTQSIQQIADTLNTFTPATVSASGAKGLVPAPAAGDNNAFLRGNGTWRKFMGGTVVVGDILGGPNGANLPTITGDITSASIANANDDSYHIVQVNFQNIGSTNYIAIVTPESIGTWSADNESADLVIRNKTATSFQIGMYERSGAIQNMRYNIMIMAL